MKELEEKANDHEWLITNLERPSTFRDRVHFYLQTRFNRRPYKSFRFISNKGGSLPKLFLYNGLVNSKYNIFTFVPLVLYSQFRVFINLFYLSMCLSQLIPILRVESPIVHMFPLALVIFVCMLKEGIEDYKRHMRDKEHNTQKFSIFSETEYVEVSSEKLKLGQLIMLKQGQRVPADILLLKTSEPNGSSFVRTDQLDGETDWKLKRAVATTQALNSLEEIYNLFSVATVEEPKDDFYNFSGKITFYYKLNSSKLNSKSFSKSSSHVHSLSHSGSSNTFNSGMGVFGNTASASSTFNNKDNLNNVEGKDSNDNRNPRSAENAGLFNISGSNTFGTNNNKSSNSFSNKDSGSKDGNENVNNSSKENNDKEFNVNKDNNLNKNNKKVNKDNIDEYINGKMIVESLNVDNIIWMNSIVASGTIHGLIIYVGKDARACLNSKRSRAKYGLFDRELNKLFFFLIVLMLGMSVLMIAPTGFMSKWYITFLKYLLLFSTIVPLSLRINLDIAKYVYNRAIVLDKKISQTMPRTTMIPEELGRVGYLLSDKTGTLTQNVISLEKLYVSRGFYTNEDINVIKGKLISYLSLDTNTTTSTGTGGSTSVGGSKMSDTTTGSSSTGTSNTFSKENKDTNVRLRTSSSKDRLSKDTSSKGGVTSSTPVRSYSTDKSDRSSKSGNQVTGKSDSLEKEVIKEIFNNNIGDSLESRLCLALLSMAICHNVRPITVTKETLSSASGTGGNTSGTSTFSSKDSNTFSSKGSMEYKDSDSKLNKENNNNESDTNRNSNLTSGKSTDQMSGKSDSLEKEVNKLEGDNNTFSSKGSKDHVNSNLGSNTNSSNDSSNNKINTSCSFRNQMSSNVDEDEIEFQASSPDEIALVKFANECGVKLVKRDDYGMSLMVHGLLLHFRILFMLPFSSETKRMGIVVEDACGSKHFFLKGAEVVLIRFLLPRGSVWLSEECDNLARMGLRTLVFGYRAISDNEFTMFMNKYKEANLSLEDRVKKIRKVTGTLEHDLLLVGLTGVRDQLQRNVRATLESLRNAGIKIWMLTGDKIDTAKCVAISAGLKERHHTVYQISVETLINPEINYSSYNEGYEKGHFEAIDKDIIDYINTYAEDDTNERQEIEYYESCLNKVTSVIQSKLEHFSMGPTNSVLILDSFVINISISKLKNLLVKSTTMASSVLCCRCTPQMKADIVKMLRNHKQIVCCIGDGDNDVPMIAEANVGVGIVGKEGLQASLSSDYSLVEFSHLNRLLLWHGSNSYKRSSNLSHFLIHRGVIISIMQAIFSSIYYFMPIAFFQGWLLVGFTSYYNMIPIFCLVLDEEISEDDVMLFPELYFELKKGRIMNFKTFMIWIWISIFQGTVLMIGAIILFENSLVSLIGIGCTSLFLLEIFNLVSELHKWHRLTIIGIVSTSIVYFYSLLVFRNNFDMEFIARKSFFWKVLLISVLGWLPVYAIKWITRFFKPPQHIKLIVN